MGEENCFLDSRNVCCYLSCGKPYFNAFGIHPFCTFILCNFKLLFLSKFLPDYLTLLKILISTRNRVTSMAILK